jgi:hypothetical protein
MKPAQDGNQSWPLILAVLQLWIWQVTTQLYILVLCNASLCTATFRKQMDDETNVCD